MTKFFNFSKKYCLNFDFGYLLERYKVEVLAFAAAFIVIFSSLKMYSTPFSNGNVEQWVNITNQMFYGRQDFLFSYGPLYWLAGGTSSQYNIYTYWGAIAFLSIINACFWSAIFTLICKARTYLFFAVTYFLFLVSLEYSSAIFLLPFSLIAYLEFSKDRPLTINARLVFALGALVGFLVYVRFFYGVVGLAAFGSYLFIRLFSEKKILRLALFFLGLIVSYVFFGLIIFHNNASLINYLIINKNLSFGNSVDMTLDVINSNNTFFAVALVVVLINTYLVLKRRTLLLTVNILLLLFFKLGFSRTDHYLVYFAIPVAALSLIMIFEKNKLGRLLFVPTIFTLYYLSANQSYPSSQTKDSLIPAIDFSVGYEDRMQSLYASFKLEEEFTQKIGKSTIDVYPYNNEYAFANKLNYKHRPSFQNYMTLTPELDSMNKKFFESSDRPKFVLLTSGITCNSENCDVFDNFDQKFSLNEDPLTSSSILLNYHAVGVSRGKNNAPLILLEENDDHTVYAETPISETAMNFGEWYKVPKSEGGATKIIPDFKLTNYGRIKNLLFRGSILKVRYKFTSGNVREYRLNIINSKSGIWVSPLLDNLELSGESVDSVKFLSQSPNYFNPEFKSRWVKINIPGIHTKDITDNHVLASIPNVNKTTETACNGSIDSINGAHPTTSKHSFNSMELLNIYGWLAFSTEDGILFDKKFVTLTDVNGKRIFISTNGQTRNDVGDAFKKTSLNAAGYNTQINLSMLNGTYTLGMGGVHNQEFYSCSQHTTPITINE